MTLKVIAPWTTNKTTLRFTTLLHRAYSSRQVETIEISALKINKRPWGVYVVGKAEINCNNEINVTFIAISEMATHRKKCLCINYCTVFNASIINDWSINDHVEWRSVAHISHGWLAYNPLPPLLSFFLSTPPRLANKSLKTSQSDKTKLRIIRRTFIS